MKIPDKKELFEAGIQEAVAYHTGDITEETMRQDGTDANSLIMAGVAIADEVDYALTQAYKNSSIMTAEGEALDILAFDWFNIKRFGIKSSVVELHFSRTGTEVGTISAGTSISTKTGIAFKTVEDVNFTAGDSDLYVPATCVTAGTIGNVKSASIVQWTPTFDQTMTVTNAYPAAGGYDGESDRELQQRCRAFWNVQQKGTKDAIIYGTRNVVGIDSAEIYETDTDNISAKYVQLLVADKTGNSNATFISAVQDEIENWRACGIWIDVQGGTAVDFPITATFSYKAGSNQLAANARLSNILINYVNSKKIGQSISPDVLKQIIQNDSAVVNSSVIITSPVATVVPDINEVLRTDITLITLN
jgi:uncharacterized phage protein gp47/JayE